MRYLGSKKRIALEILPIILADRTPDQYYVEPFMGGCNVVEHVANPRIAADVDGDLVAMFQAIQSGWIPPDKVSEEEYRQAMSGLYDPHLTGFILFGCSFGGKKRGGYARNAYDSETRTTCLETKRSLMKQSSKLRGVNFRQSSYEHLEMPDNCIVYCDPPYQHTTEYNGASGFDHVAFWDWCDRLVYYGHKIYVSEYSAPSHWRAVWQRELLQQVSSRRTATERLYTR